ncbi:MAG: DUF4333 domain-containing protein [Haloechinothrix sp.]
MFGPLPPHHGSAAGRVRVAAAVSGIGMAALLVAGCQAGNGTSPSTTPSPSAAPVPTTTTTTATPTTTLTPLPRTFDEGAVQDAVHKVLTESYQIEDLGMVICPAHQRVKAGTTFDCTATIDGQEKRVPIRVTSEKGRYSVGYPE